MSSFYRILVFCLFGISFTNLQAQIISDFSSNDDGWTVFDSNAGSSVAATYNASGGNPGGYVSFTTSSGSVNFFWTAPTKFNGNRSSSYNQNLTFDLKQSTAGADNSTFDIILQGGGWSLEYQLPTKPSSTGWSSYSIPLNEAQWHNGCPTCAAPNQIQMKQTLASITKFQIRLKYLSGNTGPYTAQLDNVVLNQSAIGTPPTITSFTPAAALAGATVTITGTNFNSTASQNIVYFKGIKATVTSATSTQLLVTVPTSAAFGQITAVNLATGLQGTSVKSFNPLFDNNKDFGGQIIPGTMSRGYYNVLQTGTESSNSFGGMDKGDIDGDGWIDLIVTETGTPKIIAYRNLGNGGAVSTASFASAITLPSLSTVPGGGPSLSEVMLVDVDSDGKLDLAASTAGNYGGGTGFLTIFKNTSTPGSISFANPLFFPYAYYSSLYMAAGDFDADGRVDFVFTTGTSPGNVLINQNLSTSGNIDFAFGFGLGTTSGLSDLAVADLNGDGKPEIIAPGYNATTISIYTNTSTLGSISMSAPFTIPALRSNSVIVAEDLDADNLIDLAWSGYNSQFVYLAKNIYSGGAFDATSFGSTISIANTLSNPNGINAGDINGDGKPEIVMSAYSDLGLLQNIGAAGALSSNSFFPTTVIQGSQVGQAIYAAAPAVADFDRDNKPDVAMVYTNNAVTASDKGVFIFHNESYPVPTISSTNPTSSGTGLPVTLNGSLMFTGNTTPSVRLNKITAGINGSPTNSSLAVTVITGSSSGRFFINNHGLSSKGPFFNATFGTNHIYTNTSFGPSVDIALANGTVYDNLETGDFDDDHKMDFVIRDANGTDIFQNKNTSGQNISTSSYTRQNFNLVGGVNSFCFDIDGDGKTDLGNASNIFQNTSIGSTISFGAGVFTSASSFSGSAYADFNKDGKVDVALVSASTSLKIYENLSTRGTFQSSGGFYTFNNTGVNFTLPGNSSGNGGIVTEDFDGDGYDDIITTIPSTDQFNVYLNAAQYGAISSSSFSLNGNYSTSGSQPHGLAANDFDGDGKTDMAICYFNQGIVSVYKNASSLGDISFNTPVDLPAATKGYAIATQDLDGDGKAEIVVIHQPVTGVNGSFTVFQNVSTPGTISFAAGINFVLTRIPQALAIADVNSDQKAEILILGSGGATAPANAVMIFQNNLQIATITVNTQPISSYSVCDGAAPVISTAASGTTNIKYQWQVDNSGTGVYTDLSNTGGYSGVSTADLTINSAGNFGAGTYRCKITGDFAAAVYTNTVSFAVNALPAAPAAPDVSNCGPGSVVITASGGVNGQYIWYDQNGQIPGQINSTYTTPSLSSTTVYSVAISNGTCVSAKTNVNAIILTSGCNAITITTQPADFLACPGGVATFTVVASGTTNIKYQWQFSIDGVVSFADITNNTNYSNATTATLSVNTTGNFGAGRYRCKIDGDLATTIFTNDEGLFINNTNCNAPVISTEPLATQIGGKVTLDLKPLIATADLDLTSLQITSTPSSGANATIDANGILTIDYLGKSFAGTEQITIKACDKNGLCTTQNFSVEVVGDIIVYNGVSPNGVNPKLVIQYIEILPDTKNNTVYIFDRWQNLVWTGNNYDNNSVVFTGQSDGGGELPSGVYFYKIDFASGRKTKTGFVSLRR